MTVSREPSRTGLGLTAVASLLGAVGTLLVWSGIALAGAAVAVFGVYRCSRRLLAVGVGVVFAGLVGAATSGVPNALLLLGAIGAVLAWDVGENAISVAEQLRAAARTQRLELVHAAMSTLVASFFGVSAYVVFLLGPVGPTIAILCVVLGAVIVLSILQ